MAIWEFLPSLVSGVKELAGEATAPDASNSAYTSTRFVLESLFDLGDDIFATNELRIPFKRYQKDGLDSFRWHCYKKVSRSQQGQSQASAPRNEDWSRTRGQRIKKADITGIWR